MASSLYGGHGPLIMGLLWTETGLATLFLILRFYTRIKVVPHAGWALFWTACSWVIGVISMALLSISVAKGMGNHIMIPAEKGTLPDAIMFSWIASSIQLVGIGLAKFAVIAFLLAVQGYTHLYGRYFLFTLGAVNMALDFALPFVIMFQCYPPQRIWEPDLPGRCNASNAQRIFGFVTASVNASTDLILAAYPIWMFWTVQMARRLKIGLCSLLGLGVFACICGTVKTYEIKNIGGYADPTYDTTSLWLWTWTEQWAILVVASIPPLWPLVVRHVKPSLLGLRDSTSNSSHPKRLRFRHRRSATHEATAVRLPSRSPDTHPVESRTNLRLAAAFAHPPSSPTPDYLGGAPYTANGAPRPRSPAWYAGGGGGGSASTKAPTATTTTTTTTTAGNTRPRCRSDAASSDADDIVYEGMLPSDAIMMTRDVTVSEERREHARQSSELVDDRWALGLPGVRAEVV